MEQIIGTLSGAGGLSGGLSIPSVRDVEPFEGSYEYTPSGQTQTIAIRGLKATSDIVINPIPNNYGLITWNGSIITVS